MEEEKKIDKDSLQRILEEKLYRLGFLEGAMQATKKLAYRDRGFMVVGKMMHPLSNVVKPMQDEINLLEKEMREICLEIEGLSDETVC